jgi:hypothetical protein
MTEAPALLGVLLAIGICASEARGDSPAPEAEPEDEGGKAGFLSADQVFDKDLPRSFADWEVDLDDVPVRRKSGRGLWIGYSARRQVFVVPIDPSFVSFVVVGATVDVRGTLRETPAAPQAAREFGLDRTSTKMIAREPLYIDAWSISYM